jgi:hypothetical protein
VLPTMVAEGIVAFSRSSALIEEAKHVAAETLASGPPPLAAETICERRYAITELAATIADKRGDAVMISVGAALHIAIADFSLRAAGRWSARGKAIPRALAAMDPTLTMEFSSVYGTIRDQGHHGRLIASGRGSCAVWWAASDRIPAGCPRGLAHLNRWLLANCVSLRSDASFSAAVRSQHSSPL